MFHNLKKNSIKSTTLRHPEFLTAFLYQRKHTTMAIADVYKNGSPAPTNPPSPMVNNLLSVAWGLCGALTVIGPSIYRNMKMGKYQNMWYKYNWEEAQQQYEQNQNEYYENNYENQYMQYYGQGNYQYQWEQMRGNYDVNQCKWYQFNCFPYYINENGEPEPMAGWYPSWFSGWTITEEEREQMLEDGETSRALVFTYVWQIIMFIIILAYGFIVIRQNRVVSGITVALIVFANMSFLAMWMLADGSIITDGEDVQNLGFFGQFPVLMFITNASYVIFGIVFASIFVIRGHYMHGDKDTSAENYKSMEGDASASGPDRMNAPRLI